MKDITPQEFVNTLFPPELLTPGEFPLLSYPTSFEKDGQTHPFHRQLASEPRVLRTMARTPRSWLYCVSTVRHRPDGKIRRTFDDINTAFALTLDDWGTKAVPAPVAPSVLMETSPGNFQAIYLIDPFDVSTPEGQDYYDACLVHAGRAGYSDPGMRSANRVAKMPTAIHRTGFVTRVTMWEPSRVWDLRELMALMGLEITKVRRQGGALKPGKFDDLADVDDGIYRWMVANWETYGHSDQWVYIKCPWHYRHSEGTGGPSSTAYSPLDYGRGGRGFKCFHGHCQGADLPEFLTTMYQLGARIK